MSEDTIPAGKRKWHIELELSNGQIQYYSIIAPDLAKFVKKRRAELADAGDARALAPLQPWVFENAIDKCRKEMLSFETGAPEITYLRISAAKKSEG